MRPQEDAADRLEALIKALKMKVLLPAGPSECTWMSDDESELKKKKKSQFCQKELPGTESWLNPL